MVQSLLAPPTALLIYLIASGALWVIARALAGPAQPNSLQQSTYASGEPPPHGAAAPGYRQFFLIALFFAVLHLGVLVLATGAGSPVTMLYGLGLLITLMIMILG